MLNLQAVLQAAGLGFSDVVRTTIYLVDLGEFATVNGIYGRYLHDPFPARATVGVAALPRGARVEIDAIAVAKRAESSGRDPSSRSRPADSDHPPQATDGPDDSIELIGSSDHYLEAVDRLFVGSAVHLGATDIDTGAADRAGNRSQHAGLIDADHLEADRSDAVGAALPDDLDAPMRIALQHARTVDGMHGHAAAARDEPEDALAGERVATAPEADQHVFDAADAHSAALPGHAPEQLAQRSFVATGALLELLRRQKPAEHLVRRHFAVTDTGNQRFLILEGHRFGHFLQSSLAL
jgi:hypothetical protein